MSRVVVVPSPSWPSSLAPQQRTVASGAIAHACRAPLATCSVSRTGQASPACIEHATRLAPKYRTGARPGCRSRPCRRWQDGSSLASMSTTRCVAWQGFHRARSPRRSDTRRLVGPHESGKMATGVIGRCSRRMTSTKSGTAVDLSPACTSELPLTRNRPLQAPPAATACAASVIQESTSMAAATRAARMPRPGLMASPLAGLKPRGQS